MLLKFTKMHGLGNDFMMVDLISQRANLHPALIRELADRRTGIGFDQLLTVTPPKDPAMDFHYTIYNADGTEAEQCGNGARCFLRFVRDRGLTTQSAIKVETNTGMISCKLEKDGNITVDMGAPELRPARIPFEADCPQITYSLNLKGCDTPVTLSAINVGNPHAVITVPDLDNAAVRELGQAVQANGRFSEGVNVGFMEIVSPAQVRLRVYERGVGETSACGSGACAAVVAGRLQGRLDETVEVQLTGGNLTISWAGNGDTIRMTGPACRVFEGRLQI